VSGESCTRLESDDGLTVISTSIKDLFSSQEEADTRIILHCLYSAGTTSDNASIVVRSPDTDVFVILLAYSIDVPQPLFFDTGVGNKRRLLDIKSVVDVLGQDIAKALPGFHSFTRCDTTSAFVRRGKVKPFQILEKNLKFIQLFQTFGSTPFFDEQLLNGLQQFVCHMYGKSTSTETNNVRYDIFRARYDAKSTKDSFSIHEGVDLSLLPPCKAALKMHCLRANYQAFVWKHLHISNVVVPSPIGCGWKCDQEGEITIDWIEGNVMPQQLVDILDSDEPESCRIINEQEDVVDEVEEQDEVVEHECEIDNILDIIFEDDQD